jgi:hypothetical protein
MTSLCRLQVFAHSHLRQVFDLLEVSSNGLQLREDQHNGVVVQNAAEMEVSSPADACQVCACERAYVWVLGNAPANAQ